MNRAKSRTEFVFLSDFHLIIRPDGPPPLISPIPILLILHTCNSSRGYLTEGFGVFSTATSSELMP